MRVRVEMHGSAGSGGRTWIARRVLREGSGGLKPAMRNRAAEATA